MTMLAMLALAYLDAYAAGDHIAALRCCRAYGIEAGRRVVFHQIPHAGYWFNL